MPTAVVCLPQNWPAIQPRLAAIVHSAPPPCSPPQCRPAAHPPPPCSEGLLYERRLPSGRVLLALVDSRMKPQLSAHVWKERPKGGRCGLFTDTGPQPGRWYLARWTAEQCLLPTGGKLPLHVAGWRHKDGCPANCLARNLEVELAPMAGRQAAAMAVAAVAGSQVEPSSAPAPRAPAQRRRQEGSREARQAARKAVQQLYQSVGAGEARRFLQALHRELQTAVPAQ